MAERLADNQQIQFRLLVEPLFIMQKLFPDIIICDELPQWIISSDRACYHPFSNTIYLRKDCKYLLFHELGHYIIEVLTHSKKLHICYDKFSSKIRKK